jgi:ankyrin repeat protein
VSDVAVAYKHANTGKTLLKHGADVDAKNRENSTLFLLARGVGCVSKFKLILQYGAADRLPGSYGWTHFIKQLIVVTMRL